VNPFITGFLDELVKVAAGGYTAVPTRASPTISATAQNTPLAPKGPAAPKAPRAGAGGAAPSGGKGFQAPAAVKAMMSSPTYNPAPAQAAVNAQRSFAASPAGGAAIRKAHIARGEANVAARKAKMTASPQLAPVKVEPGVTGYLKSVGDVWAGNSTQTSGFGPGATVGLGSKPANPVGSSTSRRFYGGVRN